MVTKTVTLQLPESSVELANGLAQFIAAIKKSLDDGFQPGTDLPVIVTAAVTSLIPVVDDVMKLGAEIDGDKLGVAQAFVIAGFDIAKVLTAPVELPPSA